jgi:hypothetical protein
LRPVFVSSADYPEPVDCRKVQQGRVDFAFKTRINSGQFSAASGIFLLDRFSQNAGEQIVRPKRRYPSGRSRSLGRSDQERGPVTKVDALQQIELILRTRENLICNHGPGDRCRQGGAERPVSRRVDRAIKSILVKGSSD